MLHVFRTLLLNCRVCDWEVVGHLLVDPWEEETPCGRTAGRLRRSVGGSVSQGWQSPLFSQQDSRERNAVTLISGRRFSFFALSGQVIRLAGHFFWYWPHFCPFWPVHLSPLQNFFPPPPVSLQSFKMPVSNVNSVKSSPAFSWRRENPSAIFPAAPLVHFPGLGWNFLRSNHLSLFFRGSDRVYPVSSGSHLMP